MKKAMIKFSLCLEVAIPDHLDTEWVASTFINSDRFSTAQVARDPRYVVVLTATSGVESITLLTANEP